MGVAYSGSIGRPDDHQRIFVQGLDSLLGLTHSRRAVTFHQLRSNPQLLRPKHDALTQPLCQSRGPVVRG